MISEVDTDEIQTCPEEKRDGGKRDREEENQWEESWIQSNGETYIKLLTASNLFLRTCCIPYVRQMTHLASAQK